MTFIHLNRFVAFLLLIILTANCQPAGKDKLFTLLPASKTGVNFANTLDENDRFNIIKYLYFYNGGGVATGDVNNDGLTDIFFTANQLSNRLFLNKGNFEFEDITEKAGLNDVTEPGKSWKTGVTMADVNADGWLDIYVCELGFYKSVNGGNRLYMNNKDGTFSEKAAEYGLGFKGFAQQASFFDYDLDGDLDLFLATHSVHSAESYVKADQRSQRDPMAGDYLFRNDDGHFTDVSEQTGIYGGKMGYALGLVTADLNNDGWPDIYVTNDFHENDYLYLNSAQNGQRVFREIIASATGHTGTFSMGVDAADLNNDGLPDVMTLDMKPEDEVILKSSAGVDHYNLYQMKLSYGYHYQFPRNCLQLSVGNGANGSPDFIEIAELAGVAATDWSWSTLLADFDNDGWKDIFITNGIWRRPNDLDYLRFASDQEVQRKASDLELAAKMPQGLVSNYAFRNRLPERFTTTPPNDLQPFAVPLFENVAQKWGLDLTGCSNGAAYADFDNDGDLDAVMPNQKAATSQDDAYDVFMNDGAGQFSALTTGGGKFDPDDGKSVALGDVNKDGYLDAVVAVKGGGNKLYLSNGASGGYFGGFRLHASFGGGKGFPEDIELGDVNGDTWLDAVVALSGNGKNGQEQVYFNLQSGTFFGANPSRAFGGGNSSAVELGDMDNDGDVDAVLANTDGNNGVYLNNGSGVFGLAFSFDPAISTDVALIDLTLDGFLDVIVTNQGSSNTTWLNCVNPAGCQQQAQ